MRLIGIGYIVCLALRLASCASQPETLTDNQRATIISDVQKMMEAVSLDLSAHGPVAWLAYFEQSPHFFMASQGQLAFANSDSAIFFISNKLVKQIRAIHLQWTNVKVDPLTANLASVASDWHENITDFINHSTSQSGYFTATAEKTSHGWKIRNAHWSMTNDLQK